MRLGRLVGVALVAMPLTFAGATAAEAENGAGIGSWTVAPNSGQPVAYNTSFSFAPVALDDGGLFELVSPAQPGAPFLAEIYNPTTNAWKYTTDPAFDSTEVAAVNATKLTDGRVLVTGYLQLNQKTIPFAEIYNPTSDTWTVVNAPSNITGGTGVSIANRVYFDNQVYDVAANSWSTQTGYCGLIGGFNYPAPDGSIFTVAQGNNTNPQYSLYYPATNTCTSIQSPSVEARHYKAVYARLDDGDVLAIGGDTGLEIGSPTNQVDEFSVTTKSWTPAPPLSVTHDGGDAITLSDGRVFVFGGATTSSGSYQDINYGEIYDPTTQTWTPTSAAGSPASPVTMAVLKNGSVTVSEMNGNTLLFNPEGSGDDAPVIDSNQTPHITATIPQALNDNDWYRTPVDINWSATAPAGDPLNVSAGGYFESTHDTNEGVLRYRTTSTVVCDAFNNCTRGIKILNLDLTPPNLTTTTTNNSVLAPGAALSGTATDASSGVAAIKVTFTSAIPSPGVGGVTYQTVVTAAHLVCTLGLWYQPNRCTWSATAPGTAGYYHVSFATTDYAGLTQNKAKLISIIVR